MIIIYCLLDPRDNMPFYVGATTKGLKPRLLAHISGNLRMVHKGLLKEKQSKIKAIIKEGYSPLIKSLFVVNVYNSHHAERAAYWKLIREGFILLQSPFHFNPNSQGRKKDLKITSEIFGFGNKSRYICNINDEVVKGFEILKQEDKEIIRLIANGLNTKEIGSILFKSHRTVETHIQQIKEKLGAKTIGHLISLCFRSKILE